MANRLVGRAIKHSFLSKYITIFLQFVTVVILARIITPEQFGIFSLSFLFISLVDIFKQYGVSNYLIQKDRLTPEIVGSAYNALLIFALVLALMVFFISDFIAAFYNAEPLAFVIKILALNVLISPFGMIINTILNKEMVFKPNLIASGVSLFIGPAFSITLGILGFGEYALAIGAVMQTLSYAVTMQFFKDRIMPYKGNFEHFREIFNYSKYISFYGILGNLGHNASQLIAGKYFSLVDVGQLNRAVNSAAIFGKIFSQALSPVVSPLIAQTKHQGVDIRDNLKLILQFQLCFAWPFYVCLGLYSDEIIVFLYGDEWRESAKYLSFLCFSRLIYSATEILDPVFIGLGLSKTLTKSALLLNSVRIFLCLIFVNFGLLAMVISITLVNPVLRLVIYLRMLKVHGGILPSEYFKWTKYPFLLMLAQFVVYSIYIIFWGSNKPSLMEFGLVMCFSLIIWSVLMYTFDMHKQIFSLLMK